jgi:Tfp pilus assembly protein PilF
MLKPTIPQFAIALMFTIAVSGCTSGRQSESDSHYQTMAKDPHRDTDLARKLTDQASAMIDQNKLPQAEAALHKALDADVMYGPAHNNLGTVYLHQNNLYLAAWEFQYAAKLMPYQPQPKSNLGLVLETAGKLNEAVAQYDDALKIEPDNPQFLGNDARARVRRGDNDQKIRDLLQRVIEVDTRLDWVDWARQRLVLMGPMPATKPQDQP